LQSDLAKPKWSDKVDAAVDVGTLDDFHCATPNGKEILYLHKSGVSIYTMTHPWILGAERVRFLDGGTFDFDQTGERALIFRAEEQSLTTDIIAWSARNEQLASWRGTAFCLGDLYQIWGSPVRIHRTPLQWLQHGREGVVIVDWTMAAAYLRNAESLLFEDAGLARVVRQWTLAPEPKTEFLLEVVEK
jgi:hypothetical protein